MNPFSYNDQLDIIKGSIKRRIKQTIIDNHNGFFDMWLSYESDLELGTIYVDEFKGQFAQYINKEIEDKIYFAGQNVVYLMQIIWKPEVELEEILEKVESFMNVQLDDFDNWCEDIGSVIYQEIGEDELERRASNRNSDPIDDKNRG
jgi:hypothetical protein